MARKKRPFTTFSMSFLDIMSCGFGAVILFFVIINHATEERSDDLTANLSGEVDLIETELALEQLNLVKVRNSLAEIEQERVITQGRADRLVAEIEQRQEELSIQENATSERREHVNQLIAEIKALEEQLKQAQAEQEQGGASLVSFSGEGNRQYLTGLRMGGRRILILLDSSASMLDETIVNVIRRRNLPDEQKIRAEKWQRALTTVHWLLTQVPPGSRYQLYTFAVEANPVLEGSAGQWLEVSEEGRELDRTIEATRKIVPAGGTRLHSAVEALASLDPLPDNVYLILDGLPTQGALPASKRETVSSRERQEFFRRAIANLPVGVPVNVLLLPMEGDPLAASEMWKLAVATGGSFLAPSRDWP